MSLHDRENIAGLQRPAEEKAIPTAQGFDRRLIGLGDRPQRLALQDPMGHRLARLCGSIGSRSGTIGSRNRHRSLHRRGPGHTRIDPQTHASDQAIASHAVPLLQFRDGHVELVRHALNRIAATRAIAHQRPQSRLRLSCRGNYQFAVYFRVALQSGP